MKIIFSASFEIKLDVQENAWKKDDYKEYLERKITRKLKMLKFPKELKFIDDGYVEIG